MYCKIRRFFFGLLNNKFNGRNEQQCLEKEYRTEKKNLQYISTQNFNAHTPVIGG